MKEFNPKQFRPDTQSDVLKRVEANREGIANPAHALAVGAAQSGDEAVQTFLSNKAADKTPPIKRDKADPNGPGYPNPVFVPPDGSGEGHLDKKMRGSEPAADTGGVKGEFDKYKRLRLKPSGKSANAVDSDLLKDYTPDENDLCGVICDPLGDAIFHARFAKTASDRYEWLSSALELIDIACEFHMDLAGDDDK